MRKTLIEVKVHLCFFLFQPVIFFTFSWCLWLVSPFQNHSREYVVTIKCIRVLSICWQKVHRHQTGMMEGFLEMSTNFAFLISVSPYKELKKKSTWCITKPVFSISGFYDALRQCRMPTRSSPQWDTGWEAQLQGKIKEIWPLTQ